MTFEHTITDLPAENEYPKLIRDRIPEIILADGREVDTRTLDDEEFLHFLLKKVTEEAQELENAVTDSNILEEIADVREILDAILELKGVSLEQIQAIQDEKRQKRGGFKLRLLMLNND
ncbi:MAG: phosphoribosyl-ATP pyrophosphohydrolase [Candidatus Saccharibacteria bacterium]|nr:phosphoribosyl-ATP pyrophosphohydrolase [Candidatus Saccharibacteria bacterium]